MNHVFLLPAAVDDSKDNKASSTFMFAACIDDEGIFKASGPFGDGRASKYLNIKYNV